MIAEKEVEVRETLNQLNSKLETIGNLVHDSVPISNDEVGHFGYLVAFSIDATNSYPKIMRFLIFLRPTMLWLDRGGRKEWSLN